MLFEVTHTTKYTFSHPVFLEPHTFRLRPQGDHRQKLLFYEMEVHPEPVGISTCAELDGNVTDNVWFSGLYEELATITRFRAETLNRQPMNFLLEPQGCNLPMEYHPDLVTVLAPYLVRKVVDSTVDLFSQETGKGVEWQTFPFLHALCLRIFQTMKPMRRHQGEPWDAGKSLYRGQGACRDLSVLFMDSCRALGLAARFVSGYQRDDMTKTKPDLHAWVEVYLPGAGWRGFDPTNGAMVSDKHVALAASVNPGDTVPITGSFRGTGATSQMYPYIRIKVTDSPSA